MSSNYFREKLFWLNGSTSGLGFAVAQTLAQNGAALVLTSRSAQSLQQAKEKLLAQGAHSIETLEYNIVEKLEKEKLDALLKGRKIQGLLLNAGGPKSGKVSSLSHEDFVAANELLVAGPARFLNSIVQNMATKNSSIVAITSTSVKEPVGELNLSAIYRSAFVVMLKQLSRELGVCGIRLNNVAPGKIKTQHLENIIATTAHNNSRSLSEVEEEMNQCSVLNRMGTPEEIASVVKFLFSEESSFINGQTFMVDGNSTKGYF